MNHRILYILPFLFVGSSCFAQSGFVSAGGDVSGATGSLSSSTGQLMVGSVRAKATVAQSVTASLNEGIQQPYTVQELQVSGNPDIQYSVFPNPTTDGVTIRSSVSDTSRSFALYSIDGRLLKQGPFADTEQVVDMATYPSGAYLLTVTGINTENKYRIVKTR